MSETSNNKRPLWVDVTILAVAGAAFTTMILLGNWQVKRLAWKIDLIEQVETRAFAEPVAAPINGEAQEYLRVHASGIFRHEKTLQVKALTELGAGYWVLTPLETDAATIWINRGFAPSGLPRSEWTEPQGPQRVNGLARLSMPGGTTLEKNKPAENRWVSVDVAAMSAASGIENAAPYYIAMDHAGSVDSWPRGGLTKLAFRNSHLSYALTWYAMAALFFAAMAYVIWDRRRETTQH